jgi:hypothetical protein
MTEQTESTVFPATLPATKAEHVLMVVPHDHPLLKLKQALPWQQIEQVMVSAWRVAGKNLNHAPGRPWPVALYVPLLVLMILKRLDSRQMEAYVKENAVARVFVGEQHNPRMPLRDHATIARALAALGTQGTQQLNELIILEATSLGFADPRVLSADTTAQELPIGYPHEAGILKGIAQRCLRALKHLKDRGVSAVDTAVSQGKLVVKTVKEYHLFAKDKNEKTKVLKQLMVQSKQLISHTTKVVRAVGHSNERVISSACEKLLDMKRVTQTLLPQIRYWLDTGWVAQGKILHAGIPEARAIVRNKAGKRIEFGLPYLISRLGGGYVFGKLLAKLPNETKMPLLSLAGYREIFGLGATPELMVYDRGGFSAATIKRLKRQGVTQIGIQPKGQAAWLVAEEVQRVVLRERGKTEGAIGTLKSEKYGFNKPKQRTWESLQAAGQQALLSLNLNKLMRDLVNTDSHATLVPA